MSPTLDGRRLDSGTVLASGRTRGWRSTAADARTDWVSIACMVALGITGVFFIYSAQKFTGADYWLQQIMWLGIGAVVYTTVSLIDYKVWLQYGHIPYIFSLLLLLAIWTPLGVEREGARRWLNLHFLSYQPSEAAKIAVLLMVCSVLARGELGTLRQSMWALVKVGIILALPMFLIFCQPDLGSTVVFGPMIFSLLYVSRLSQRFFIVVLGVFLTVLAVVGLDMYRYYEFLETERAQGHAAYDIVGQYEAQHQGWLPLHDYQRNRLLTFVAPDVVDPSGIGISWNYHQSLQAVGTGGLFGKGWTKGDQAQLGYLPRSVAHNDFIFAVLAEEMGFAGAAFVVGVYFVLLINNLRVAGMARDRFGLLLVVGVSVIFMFHVFVNIGMTIGLMPIKGLPLPFMSYGGSFILSCSILMGLVQSVHRHRRVGI